MAFVYREPKKPVYLSST